MARPSTSCLVALCLALAVAACDRGEPPPPAAVTAADPADVVAPIDSGPDLDLAFSGRDPAIAWGPDGSLHAVYVEPAVEPPRLVWRRLAPQLSEPRPVSAPESVVNSHGEVPPILGIFPDGTLLTAYTISLPGQWKGEIRLQRSRDGGDTWSAPELLHDDGKLGSHNFLAAAHDGRGQMLFSWLDGRDGGQGLRFATAGAEGPIRENLTLDPSTCECCATAILPGPDDALWIAYRDREPADIRDIAVVASDDGGASFTAPRPLSADGWEINGCPHTGPRLTRDDQGAVWAVWFTGASPAPGIYTSVSRDGGASFAPRHPLALPGPGITGVSHPEIGVLPDGRLLALYEASGNPEATGLFARLAESDGRWGPPQRLAPGDATYARLAIAGPRVALSYTRHGEAGPEVVVRTGSHVVPMLVADRAE